VHVAGYRKEKETSNTIHSELVWAQISWDGRATLFNRLAKNARSAQANSIRGWKGNSEYWILLIDNCGNCSSLVQEVPLFCSFHLCCGWLEVRNLTKLNWKSESSFRDGNFEHTQFSNMRHTKHITRKPVHILITDCTWYIIPFFFRLSQLLDMYTFQLI